MRSKLRPFDAGAGQSPARHRSAGAVRTERRRSPRYLCSHLIEISCGAEALSGVLEDLSLEGAGFSVDSPLERCERVELAAPGVRFRAEVRYCLPRETDFRVGVEFVDGARWDQHRWRPDHLYLPPGVL